MNCSCVGDRLVVCWIIVEGTLNYSRDTDTRETKAIVFE